MAGRVIVEFVGCSGAGKTTLARALVDGELSGQAVVLSDLIMDRPGLRRIANQKARNVVADLTALPWFFRTLKGNRRFVRFAFDRLEKYAPSTSVRLNYKRNIVRRVGSHELAQHRGGPKSVLVDEGVVLTAYFLFVYSKAPYSQSELDLFTSLVPLPDRIVYLTSHIDTLVHLAMARSDRRRELASDDRGQVRAAIERAVDVFNGLASCDAVRDRIVIVDNSDDATENRDALTRRVAKLIEGWHPSDDEAASPAPPHSTGT